MFSQHQPTPAPPPLHRHRCWCSPPCGSPPIYNSAVTLKHGRLAVRYRRGMANKRALSLIEENKVKHFLKQTPLLLRSASREWGGGGMGAWDVLEKVKTENCKVLAGDQLGASWDSERRDTMSQILIPLWFGNAPVTGERRHCWISEMFDIFILNVFCKLISHSCTGPPMGEFISGWHVHWESGNGLTD